MKKDVGGDIIYCDRCGKNPYYISKYKTDGFDDEEFVCKSCYEADFDSKDENIPKEVKCLEDSSKVMP